MIYLKQKNGNTLFLDGFHLAVTYGTLLEGTPDMESNQKIVKNAEVALEKICGKRKTHVIQPSLQELQTQLPEMAYHAWLTGNSVKNENCDGAGLVWVWFGNEEPDKSIKQIIEEQIRELDWENLAQNFFY